MTLEVLIPCCCGSAIGCDIWAECAPLQVSVDLSFVESDIITWHNSTGGGQSFVRGTTVCTVQGVLSRAIGDTKLTGNVLMTWRQMGEDTERSGSHDFAFPVPCGFWGCPIADCCETRVQKRITYNASGTVPMELICGASPVPFGSPFKSVTTIVFPDAFIYGTKETEWFGVYGCTEPSGTEPFQIPSGSAAYAFNYQDSKISASCPYFDFTGLDVFQTYQNPYEEMAYSYCANTLPFNPDNPTGIYESCTVSYPTDPDPNDVVYCPATITYTLEKTIDIVGMSFP